jgi:hypothetical protein
MIGVIMRPERTPLGKNSERIETSVPEVIRAEMTALAVAADMSKESLHHSYPWKCLAAKDVTKGNFR